MDTKSGVIFYSAAPSAVVLTPSFTPTTLPLLSMPTAKENLHGEFKKRNTEIYKHIPNTTIYSCSRHYT